MTSNENILMLLHNTSPPVLITSMIDTWLMVKQTMIYFSGNIHKMFLCIYFAVLLFHGDYLSPIFARH